MDNKLYTFHNERREVELHRYNPPTPWMNYLSNGAFHTMISGAGGGVAFYRSPQIWRINHYRFFHLPTDRSGFYTYIKDGGSIWCPTGEPCIEKPTRFSAFHGMGYTRFEAEHNGLRATVNYFVGPTENCLIWKISLQSNTDRTVSLFPYVELGMMEFMRELQWQCYNKHQLSCYALDDVLVYRYGVEMQPKPKETPLIYFAGDYPVSAYDCDRDAFIGTYHSEENPLAFQENGCSNSELYGGDPCFAMQFNIPLKAFEKRTVHVYLGAAMSHEEIQSAVARCRCAGFSDKSFQMLQSQWDDYLNKYQCRLPDMEAETMINIWNPYQAQRNFQFSRNISYYATGTFRGVGFRDTAQDILATIPFDQDAALEKICLLLGQQYRDGHVNHYFFPTEGWEPVTRIHSDNHLWIIYAVHALLLEIGRLDFLDIPVPFYDGGEGTIWEHLKKSIDFTMQNIGSHGLPLMLHSDWNDMLYKVCREGRGESAMVAMQLCLALTQMQEIALLRQEENRYAAFFHEMKQVINSVAWDGEWYIRGFMDNGEKIGSSTQPQAKIWLNTQTWAILSGVADAQRGQKAMDSVYAMLDTELGIKKIHPSMQDYPTAQDPLTHYQKGCGENGSIFCHANTWAIMAECMLCRPEMAYHYYRQLLPMVAQEKAGVQRYRAEPYVYASNIFGPENRQFGLANVSWLTGTATWMYVAVTQHILGVKASWDGLYIEPCLPSAWKEIKVTRLFRGCKYNITIHSNKKVFIPHVEGRKEHELLIK